MLIWSPFIPPPLPNQLYRKPALQKEAKDRKVASQSCCGRGVGHKGCDISQLPAIMFLNVPTSLAILSSFPPFTKSSSSQQRPGAFIVPGYPPFLPSKQLHTLICNFSIMVSLSFSFCYYPVFHSRKQRREKKGKKGRRGSGGGRREGRNKIPR